MPLRPISATSAPLTAAARTGVVASPAGRLAPNPTVNAALRRSAEQVGAPVDPRKFSRADQQLALDLAQMALDITGFVDPTPISDGAGALLALARGDWGGALISAAGMLPYVGDAAKVGRLGKHAQTVAKAVERIADNPALAQLFRPVLGNLRGALAGLPNSVVRSLPQAAQGQIRNMQRSLDKAFGTVPAGARVVRLGATTRSATIGRNQITWSYDANNRLTGAKATLGQTFPNKTVPRSSPEITAQGKVAARGIPTDHGGHLVGHQFAPGQGAQNMFPQNGVGEGLLKNLNGGAYKALEGEMARWIDKGMTVKAEWRLENLDAVGRPGRIVVRYSVHKPGATLPVYSNQKVFDNKPSAPFNSVKDADMKVKIDQAR